MKNFGKLKLKKSDLGNIAFRELSIIKNYIFWIDFIHDGDSVSNALFVRPFNAKNAAPQQLTGKGFNLKCNFHGYGGKSYKCIEIEKYLYLIWIDQFSKAIWFEIFELKEKAYMQNEKYLLSIQSARQVSKKIDGNFDSSFVVTKKNFLYGICEIQNEDYLFSLNLEKTNQDIHLLKKFDNFAGDLSSNTSANLLSWIEWGTPYMPWEKNDLFFAEISDDYKIKNIKKFSNELINKNRESSFFQPYWLSEKFLICSEDSSGWWNLVFIDLNDFENIVVKKRIKKRYFEYGLPQWVSGITLFSGSINNLFCLAKKDNNWIIEQYKDLNFFKKFDLPFSSVSDFTVFDQRVAFKGYGPDFLGTLVELDFDKKVSFNLEDICITSINECSKPENFWFKGFNNQPTHSFIYRPLLERFNKPPLLIRAHSGPTACFDGSFNAEVQYWTTKGFFVAEVNYGGSSGFGRDYRERLNYKWGIVDSYDCEALVIQLLKLNIVDRNKVIIFGNSAGGLTALNSLCNSDLFKAAVCKYPVIDLVDMYHNTHRFEKDYLNSLVGDYKNFLSEYKTRSPINKINTIRKPILLFHGKKDLVISYKQSLNIQEHLRKSNKYSDVVFFEDEGHGFKNKKNKESVLVRTEKFLNQAFNI